MVRASSAALLLLWLSSSSLHSQTAKVAAWNLAGNNVDHLTPAILAQQARAISLFQPDIILLTEVDLHTAASDIASDLRGAPFNLPYSHLIIDQPQTNLDIGILFKDTVHVGVPGLIPGSDLDLSDYRKAFFVDVRVGSFDFRLIGVHFKSAACNTCKRNRKLQAENVASFIAQFVEGEEKDVLVVGDYNMFPARDQESFDALDGNDFLRFVSTEALCTPPTNDDCIATHIQSTPTGAQDGNLLDGFAISKNHTNEYQSDLARVELPTLMGMTLGAFRVDVSDHYPLMATFSIVSDDDGTQFTDEDQPGPPSSRAEPISLSYRCLCLCGDRLAFIDVPWGQCEQQNRRVCLVETTEVTFESTLSECQTVQTNRQ